MEKLYKVRITPRAEQSMQEIASYIAVGLMEPQTAVKLLRALKKAIDSLDMFPGRIRPTPEEPWHSLGIRRLVVKIIMSISGLMRRISAFLSPT